MSDQKLRFGLIGLGEIAFKSTGSIFQRCEMCEMVAGVDPVEDVAASYEKEFGIPCGTDLDAMLARDNVDAVIVSTPHYLHAPLGVEAANAGKHVIVEKPMATTLEDADALISACKANGVLLSSKESGVHYQPQTQKARSLIQDGVIGEVMGVQIAGASNKPNSYWTGGYSNRVKTTWRMSKEQSGGGILVMNYIYDVYRMRYVTGLDVKRVFAEYDTFKTDVEVEDYITVSLRFENGAVGTITAGSAIPGARQSGVRGTETSGNRIYGTKGQIVFVGQRLLVFTENEVEGLTQNDWTELSFEDARVDSYVSYFDRFADAVFEGRQPDVPGEEGRKTLEILVGAYKSGQSNQPVNLPL
ncbi:MAG: Gfo/Idh/MocA family oxidoreductase [Candidatus Latescibacterota bacterium]|nr:Gfo/Idh/MocA family oxidoreductase [Candidatus Latescibacterota bacterium]